MTTGQKICECRKERRMTQEELADRLGVSRQAVSKWEADVAFPETEKILELCKLFSLSADELLFGEARSDVQQTEIGAGKTDDGCGVTWGQIRHKDQFHFEYVSKTKLRGIPLYHVNIGLGACKAKGIIAVGNVATGVVSFGFVSVGIFAMGFLSLGLLGFGAVAIALLLGAGGVATGALAFGGVAVGILTFGGCSIGYVAVGGYAAGQYAVGGAAHGYVAVGVIDAVGEHAFIMPQQFSELETFINQNVSPTLGRILRALAKSLGKQ